MARVSPHTDSQISGRATRVAAILVEIDANDLNNVFVCRHFIILKIGTIGNFLGSTFL